MTFLRKIRSGLGLVVLGAAITWWLLPSSGLGVPRLAHGPMDARGFRVARVHADSGDPVRYNPCEPIHYVINPALAPASGVEDIHTAIEMTSQASGLRFVYDGTTTELPMKDRPSYQPNRYGDRWAPILVSWSNNLEQSATGPEGTKTIGWGGSAAELNEHGEAVLVTGMATFDATATEIPEGFGGETWGQAMLHEFGHVLGLDHHSTSDSVMHPQMGLRAAMWGPGDRAGLWSLGLGSPCIGIPQTP